MAAVTSTLVALGGVGLSAAQAIKANKDMKQAASAADLAKQQLKQIKETNPFKAVQTPMLGFELAQQQQSQREAQMVTGLGAEGAIGGIGQLAQAGNEQDLQLAAQAKQTQFQRDMAQAEAESGIQDRKAERDWMAGIGDIQEQNMRRYEAASNRNAAIGGAFSSATTAALGIDEMIDLYRKNKSTPNAKAGAGGGVNWDYLFGNKPNYLNLQQPQNMVTGSNINNPNAVLGNQGNQVQLP